jgi:RNA polymerase sigma-B factor
MAAKTTTDRALARRMPAGDERMNLGRSATVQEVAQKLGCDDDTVHEAMAAGSARALTSLDSPVQDGSGGVTSVGELIPFVDPELERAEARATIDQLTAVLDPRAREIVRLRYEEDLLQSEIAARVGCSQIHVSRILRASIAKLQAYAGATATVAAAA